MSEPAQRYRLSVPQEDTSTIRWLKAQHNPSISLRLIIRKAIEENGYTDVTCGEVKQLPKRGRPVSDSSIEVGPDADDFWRTPGGKAYFAEKQAERAAKAEQKLRDDSTPQEKDSDGFVDPEKFFG